jgi:hypothetical protein
VKKNKEKKKEASKSRRPVWTYIVAFTSYLGAVIYNKEKFKSSDRFTSCYKVNVFSALYVCSVGEGRRNLEEHVT